MVTIRPHLWFANNQASEAARFYARHIPNSSVTRTVRAPDGVPGIAAGTEFIVEFVVAGLPVIGLNAGPVFELDEAFSFYLLVDDQAEVDHYWDVLTRDGGSPSQCGWCKDRFGVSWQVVPRQLGELSGDYSTPANERVLQAILQMTKIDVATLQAAYAETV